MLTKEVVEIVELAAKLGERDFGEMVKLVTMAAAAVSMIPYSSAATIEAAAARIANRTKADEARIDGSADLFLAAFREAINMMRYTPMTFDVALPPGGEA